MMNNATDTNKIKTILGYLRSLHEDDFSDYAKRESIGAELVKMGAKYLSNGCFSDCYSIGKFVIKIASQSFEKLRTARTNKVFKRFAPAIYWMHECGKAILCQLVEIVKVPYSRQVAFRFSKMLKSVGFEGCDLHSGNLVKIKVQAGMRWSLVDYGCWIGN